MPANQDVGRAGLRAPRLLTLAAATVFAGSGGGAALAGELKIANAPMMEVTETWTRARRPSCRRPARPLYPPPKNRRCRRSWRASISPTRP